MSKKQAGLRAGWSESNIFDRLEREFQRKLNNAHRISQAADFTHASSIRDQRVCCGKADTVRIAEKGVLKALTNSV
jgi:hypothetical protein